LTTQPNGFPGGSKSRVNRAGAAVRAGSPTAEDLGVIDGWRAAHRAVLNTFQAILRTRTRSTDVTVAQRHKRKSTIFGKLDRFPKMELSRMDDVAGCRLIFQSVDKLYEFRDAFLEARFNHQRRNAVDRYDYIKHPKSTGYRGIHDVYSYDVNSLQGRPLKGLLVEIQYRTLVQHAWATTVEVIGFITESQPKFEEGDTRYIEAMALASEILARTWESRTGPYPDLDGRELVRQFLALDQDLGLIAMLQGLNSADAAVTSNRNIILIIAPSGDLEVRTFRDATQALRELFELERSQPENDIVLVKADTGEEVRLAFRNYFSDARDFIRMIERGCEILVRGRVVRKRRKKPASKT
jgi:ppGpp synthetase/RelA/SpoT-type nucleotidyltranferase